MKNRTILFSLLIGTSLFADVKKGEDVYKANCAICHTIDGRGGLGPDFNMVSYKRTKEEIASYAKDPYSLSEKFGYSANAMPTLPLTNQEFKDVADYVSSLVKFKVWMKKRKDIKKELVKVDNNSSKLSS
ncbi:MAG: cytochrome c [Epsilonproteobacteria bacterium]|nr:cytochrome c [Campylobacterota bacterium]